MSRTKLISLESLSKNWLAQTRDYRPSAFWFWNADMNKARMREVVSEMGAADIREVVFHPIHGLEIEYLSAEYFDHFRYGLELAREHHLKVWVYDEFGWPSGNAGGLLLRDFPQHRGWSLQFNRDEQGRVTATPERSDMVLDNVMGSPWTRAEGGYLDTLSMEAVRAFIDLTYERVYQECGDLFNEVVAGFFTDEPTAMAPRWNGSDAGPWLNIGLPWTPTLPKLFKERFGYEIEPRYHELAGDHPGAVKRDYWTIVKQMYSEAFYGQIGRWCRGHGVKFTGHAGEDILQMQTRFSGSLYECLRHMDEPGIDYLSAKPEPEHRFVEEIVVTSIAKHTGKERVFCEAYGTSPLDLRLADMLKRAQMFGVHGIDDIALMGFHQSQDGIRKHLYWPPLFTEAPWWPFYPEFRDAFARSVGLASLGKQKPRYAVLYPQDELEQADLFRPVYAEDTASPKIHALGLAVYAAGETFDFVFLEMLDQAEYHSGRIHFPHASYEALLAPLDLPAAPAAKRQLGALQRQGACVHMETTECVAAAIRSEAPSWSGHLDFSHDGEAGAIRLYPFEYSDGTLYAIRNVTGQEIHINIAAQEELSEWEPAPERVTALGHKAKAAVGAHGIKYYSVTKRPIGENLREQTEETEPLADLWRVSRAGENTARLSNVRFFHHSRGWTPASESANLLSAPTAHPTGIPISFAGQTRIAMQAEFFREDALDTLGLLFERDHVAELKVNGTTIDLKTARQHAAWDSSCRRVEIGPSVKQGLNTLSATLAYQPFETSIESQAFYYFHPMPSADLVLSGDFWVHQGILKRNDGAPLPLGDLSSNGLGHFRGTAILRSSVCISEEQSGRIRGIFLNAIAEDGIEVLIDGQSLGRRIQRPYRFDIIGIEAGEHAVEIRISGITATLFGASSPWGLNEVRWITAAPLLTSRSLNGIIPI